MSLIEAPINGRTDVPNDGQGGMMLVLMLAGCLDDTVPSIDKPAAVMTIAQDEYDQLTFDIEPKELDFTSYDGNAAYRSYALQNTASIDLELYSSVWQELGTDQVFFLKLLTGAPSACTGFGTTGQPDLSDECATIVKSGEVVSSFAVFEPGWSKEAMALPGHAGVLSLDIIPSDGTIEFGSEPTNDDSPIKWRLGLVGTIIVTGGAYTPTEMEMPDVDTGDIDEL